MLAVNSVSDFFFFFNTSFGLGVSELVGALSPVPMGSHYVVGMLWVVSDINQLSVPTPFYSVLVSISVSMALSAVFHPII